MREDGMWSDVGREDRLWSDTEWATDILKRSRRPLLSFFPSSLSFLTQQLVCPLSRIEASCYNPFLLSCLSRHHAPLLSFSRLGRRRVLLLSLSCPVLGRRRTPLLSLSCLGHRHAPLLSLSCLGRRCAPLLSLSCLRPPAACRPCPVRYLEPASLCRYTLLCQPNSPSGGRTSNRLRTPPNSPGTPKSCPANHPKLRPKLPISRSHPPY